MKVAILFTGIGVLPGRTNNVSGHLQFPIKTAEILQVKGHDVTILATRQSDGTALPAILPEGVRVVIVSDGRRRGQFGKQNYRDGYVFHRLLQQLYQTIKVIREEDFDLIHVFGYERMMRLGGILKISSGKPVVVTVLGQKPSGWFTFLYKYVSRALFLTESVRDRWLHAVANTEVVYPGVVRKMRLDNFKPAIQNTRTRVLFWREASELGGGDVCMDAFEKLAPMYPHLSFDFAVRSNRNEVGNLDELGDRYHNINVYRFPYKDGLSLEQLIDQSLVVVLPFRGLSVEPQMAVVETLSVGCPVICTDIGCLPELVVDGENGWLVRRESSDDIVNTLCRELRDINKLNLMRTEISRRFNEKWNWSSYQNKVEHIYTMLCSEK